MDLHFIKSLLYLFNDTTATEIYTLSLHDALPICGKVRPNHETNINIIARRTGKDVNNVYVGLDRKSGSAGMPRPISYAVFCLKKKKRQAQLSRLLPATMRDARYGDLLRRSGSRSA